MLLDLDLRSMNIFLLLENINISTTNVEFFERQGFLKLCFQLVQEAVSHYYKSLFIRYTLQTPTHIPTFLSFIWIVDTCGLRWLQLTSFKHKQQRKPGVPTKWESENYGILPKFQYQFDDSAAWNTNLPRSREHELLLKSNATMGMFVQTSADKPELLCSKQSG